MRILGVIPARYASTRFPGKMLAPISGKPMILWTLEGAKTSAKLDHIIVATDDERISNVCEQHGADTITTSPTCKNGMERVAEVAKKLHLYDIIVNIQGDEPLISGKIIDTIIDNLISQPTAGISTGYVCDLTAEKFENPDIVKVVTDVNNFALYFSRSPIPNGRNSAAMAKRHIGIYAYRWENLLQLSRMRQTPIEREESLEQMRALESGIKIFCADIPDAAKLIGVDRPEDIKKVEATIASLKK
jgi:3-deoxy-manno-octulosonate cytidylyltransferase (CMP-KDO synthetase)